MVNDFLKKYYIKILDKAKKDIHDCRVYLYDFKGNYSRLQALEKNIQQLGINTNGYDNDNEGRDGYGFGFVGLGNCFCDCPYHIQNYKRIDLNFVN